MKVQHLIALVAGGFLLLGYIALVGFATDIACYPHPRPGQDCEMGVGTFFSGPDAVITFGVFAISIGLIVYAIRGMRQTAIDGEDAGSMDSSE